MTAKLEGVEPPYPPQPPAVAADLMASLEQSAEAARRRRKA